MFSVYKVAASFTTAQVQADLVGLLTGTITNVANCSASCNSGASSLIRTVLPDWEMHDAAAGSGAVVLKSQWTDDETKFKYIKLSVSGSAIRVDGFQGWNSTTHAGTDQVNLVAAQWNLAQINASGFIIISASKAHLGLWAYNVNFSSTLGQGHSWVLLSEYTRDDPWNTVAAGYPSWLMTGANLVSAYSSYVGGVMDVYSGGATARVYNITTGQDVANFSWYTLNAPTAYAMYLRPYSVLQTPIASPAPYDLPNMMGNSLGYAAVDANKAPATFIYPISLVKGNDTTRLNSLFLGGNMSSKSNMVFMTKIGRGNNLDEIQLGSDLFSLVTCYGYNGYGATLALRKV